MTTAISLLALAIFLLIVVASSVKIVPQSSKWVITRLGVRHKVLEPGLGFIVPLLDRVHRKVFIADKVHENITIDVVSKDNVVFQAEMMVVYRIEKPEEAIFRVDSVDALAMGLVRSLARSEIGRFDLDQVQSDRTQINDAIKESLKQAAEDYGLLISRAEITDVRLQERTQLAMAEVLEAERTKRATITRAEGNLEAAKMNADAALYDEEKRAQGIVAMAEATATANKLIGEAIALHGDKAAQYQISQAQINAVISLSKSNNSKVVMLPGDISDGMTRAAALLMQKD